MNKDPTISAPVIGLCNNINPVIIATNGSRLDSIDAFEASTCLILLFQISVAIPCTTIAVPIKRAQSETFVLIRNGLSSKKANGIRSEEHTSELQSRGQLVCRLLLEKKNNNRTAAANPP